MLNICVSWDRCILTPVEVMKKTSVVALVLLVLAASHFRVSSANMEIASKSCEHVHCCRHVYMMGLF